MTVWLLAGMTTVLVGPVLLLLIVPLQPLTAQPAEGTADTLIVAFSVYWSFGQPVELGGLAVGLLPLPVCCRLRV